MENRSLGSPPVYFEMKIVAFTKKRQILIYSGLGLLGLFFWLNPKLPSEITPTVADTPTMQLAPSPGLNQNTHQAPKSAADTTPSEHLTIEEIMTQLRDAPKRAHHYSDVMLPETLQNLATEAGIRLTLNAIPNVATSLKLRSASPFAALETMAETNGMALVYYDREGWVTQPFDDFRVINRRYRFKEPIDVETLVASVKHLQDIPADTEIPLQDDSDATITWDAATNSLSVRTSRTKHQWIEKLMTENYGLQR